MDNKEIQNQRMKGYFIQATKEILKGEGLRNVSVRNVARQAGYSYATLYNYFRDIKDLVFECVKDFQDECQQSIQDQIKNVAPGKARIKTISKAYIKFFIQYPGIYELFFLEKTHELAYKQPTVQLISTFLLRVSDEDWQQCIEQKILNEKQAEVMKTALNYLVTGMLHLYLTKLYPASFPEFMDVVEKQLNNILEI